MKFKIISLLLIIIIGCKTTNNNVNQKEKTNKKIISERQLIELTVNEICKEIKIVNYEEKDTLKIIKNQIEIYHKVLKRNILNNISIASENTLPVFGYELTRKLNSDCEKFKLNDYILPIRLNIYDIEKIFTQNEEKEIKELARQIEINKKVRLLIVTLDKTEPYENVTEFAEIQGRKWNIGIKNQNGGIIIVFSNKDRQIRISTTSAAQKLLTDNEIQLIINKISTEYFKNGNYYQGILKMLTELDEKIQNTPHNK